MLNISQNIKYWRKIKNLRQIDLAKQANISRVYLARIETQKQQPTLKKLYQIAEALNINPALLIDPNIKNYGTDTYK